MIKKKIFTLWTCGGKHFIYFLFFLQFFLFMFDRLKCSEKYVFENIKLLKKRKLTSVMKIEKTKLS